MRKMFKAAASLAVGCAMLSTSAFAALTGTPALSDDKSAVNVTVSGVGASKESTILVLKGARTEMPATINEDDIVYINQQTAAADGTATYSMPLGTRVGDAAAVTVFAGATDESAATLLGSVTLASEPDRDFITAADTTKATIGSEVELKKNSATITIDGVSMKSVVVELNKGIYDKAGNEAAGYILTVVDNDGNAVENAMVLYSPERKKYVALIPTTVTSYKFEVTTEGTANKEFIYGDINGDKALKTRDATMIKTYLKAGTILTTWDKIIAADVSGDGKVMTRDATMIGTAIKNNTPLSITTK